MDVCGLSKGPPNRMQRLSRFPAAPHVSPLRHGKFHVFPFRHRHHLGRKIYIRWCCIDLSKAPVLSGCGVWLAEYRAQTLEAIERIRWTPTKHARYSKRTSKVELNTRPALGHFSNPYTSARVIQESREALSEKFGKRI